MPRYAAAVDANQAEIVSALRDVGAKVWPTHRLGKGFPDIVVGYKGLNYMIEIKDGSKPPSARKLTEDEQLFHDMWSGQIATCKNINEALSVIGLGPSSMASVPVRGTIG